MFSKSERSNIIEETNGYIHFQITNESGEMHRKKYDVYEGVQLVYNDVHMRQCYTDIGTAPRTNRIIEVDHCKEGRLECSKGKDFFYLSPGDMAVHRNADVEHNSFFPTCHYHGITLVIDLDSVPKCLSCIINDVDICPENIANRFCNGDNLFITRSNRRLEHIFSELYNVPEEVKQSYFKIKVLEILLFLSYFPIDAMETRKPYTFMQVQLAKEVRMYLAENINRTVRIEELARKFHVSPSKLQNCFRGVYGKSVYDHIRFQKMQSAAQMLENTNKTVLEIANLHGYENGGKFAAAFAKIMGLSPSEYRKVKHTTNFD